jgi:hypothetical protein
MTGAGNPRVRIVLSPGEGEMVWFEGLGVRFMIDGTQTEGTFALVEYPIEPRTLAAPTHAHRHEDEYTHVLWRARSASKSGTKSVSPAPATSSSSLATCRRPSGTRATYRRGRSKSSPPLVSSDTSGRSRRCYPRHAGPLDVEALSEPPAT